MNRVDVPRAGGSKLNPYGMLVIAIVGVSFGSFLAKLSDAPALIIATYRSGFASLILTPFALATCGRELASIPRKDLRTAAASGVFLAFHFAIWIASLEYTSVANSTVLVTMQPIFVVIGSFLFLHEPVSTKAVLSGIGALAGSVLIGLSDSSIGGGALWGDFLALSGAVLISGYMLIGRRLRQKYSLLTYTFVVYWTCTLVLVGLDLVSGVPLFPYSSYNWMLFILMALIPTIIGHNLLNWALKYLPAPTVSVSVLGEPVGATILAAVFLGEMLHPLQFIGGMCTLVSVYLFMKFSHDANKGREKKNQRREA